MLLHAEYDDALLKHADKWDAEELGGISGCAAVSKKEPGG